MDIFEFAKEKEVLAEQNYLELAAKTNHRGLANILNMLADEEHKHIDVVTKMQQQSEVEVTDTDILGDAVVLFKKIRDGAESFDFDVSETELYKKAQQIEENARDFYLEKSKEVDDPQKTIFEKLAGEEQKHFRLLENIVDFVSRPEQWLEDAEWNHLEEY